MSGWYGYYSDLPGEEENPWFTEDYPTDEELAEQKEKEAVAV